LTALRRVQLPFLGICRLSTNIENGSFVSRCLACDAIPQRWWPADLISAYLGL
jgi:hypothetical protein